MENGIIHSLFAPDSSGTAYEQALLGPTENLLNEFTSGQAFTTASEKSMYCINCGKKGHVYKKCLYPIISIGIICVKFKINDFDINYLINYSKKIQNNYLFSLDEISKIKNIKKKLLTNYKSEKFNSIIEYLLIRRKHSLNYVEFVRGKYDINNSDYLERSFNFITNEEIKLIMANDFEYLWKDMWGSLSQTQKSVINSLESDCIDYKKTDVIIDSSFSHTTLSNSSETECREAFPEGSEYNKFQKSFSLLKAPDSCSLISKKNLTGRRSILDNTIISHSGQSVQKSVEFQESKDKFENLKKGIIVKKNDINILVSFDTLIKRRIFNFEEPEWGFPKGRRNLKEKNIECAKREFEEETSLTQDFYNILNITPLEETYLATNNIKYKHIYYISQINDNNINLKIDKNNSVQQMEVSDIKWLNFDEAMNTIRSYNIEKKNILFNLHNSIKDIIETFLELTSDI
jgi:8-oxo-dGTP pyrophosphatase MutT (NUDIX family)